MTHETVSTVDHTETYQHVELLCPHCHNRIRVIAPRQLHSEKEFGEHYEKLAKMYLRRALIAEDLLSKYKSLP